MNSIHIHSFLWILNAIAFCVPCADAALTEANYLYVKKTDCEIILNAIGNAQDKSDVDDRIQKVLSSETVARKINDRIEAFFSRFLEFPMEMHLPLFRNMLLAYMNELKLNDQVSYELMLNNFFLPRKKNKHYAKHGLTKDAASNKLQSLKRNLIKFILFEFMNARLTHERGEEDFHGSGEVIKIQKTTISKFLGDETLRVHEFGMQWGVKSMKEAFFLYNISLILPFSNASYFVKNLFVFRERLSAHLGILEEEVLKLYKSWKLIDSIRKEIFEFLYEENRKKEKKIEWISLEELAEETHVSVDFLFEHWPQVKRKYVFLSFNAEKRGGYIRTFIGKNLFFLPPLSQSEFLTLVTRAIDFEESLSSEEVKVLHFCIYDKKPHQFLDLMLKIASKNRIAASKRIVKSLHAFITQTYFEILRNRQNQDLNALAAAVEQNVGPLSSIMGEKTYGLLRLQLSFDSLNEKQLFLVELFAYMREQSFSQALDKNEIAFFEVVLHSYLEQLASNDQLEFIEIIAQKKFMQLLETVNRSKARTLLRDFIQFLFKKIAVQNAWSRTDFANAIHISEDKLQEIGVSLEEVFKGAASDVQASLGFDLSKVTLFFLAELQKKFPDARISTLFHSRSSWVPALHSQVSSEIQEISTNPLRFAVLKNLFSETPLSSTELAASVGKRISKVSETKMVLKMRFIRLILNVVIECVLNEYTAIEHDKVDWKATVGLELHEFWNELQDNIQNRIRSVEAHPGVNGNELNQRVLRAMGEKNIFKLAPFETYPELLAALVAINEEFRGNELHETIIQKRFYQGMAVKEIARIFRCTVQNVYAHERKLYDLLKRRWIVQVLFSHAQKLKASAQFQHLENDEEKVDWLLRDVGLDRTLVLSYVKDRQVLLSFFSSSMDFDVLFNKLGQ